MTEKEPRTTYVKSDCGGGVAGMRRFSHEAMATTYEVLVVHEDERYARQAAAAAFGEVDRLEAELSRFIDNSDVSKINRLAAVEPVVVGLATFECLEISRRIFNETGGAFDITIGSLLKCRRSGEGKPRTPTEDELAAAIKRTGTDLLKLNEDEHTVAASVEGVQVDLGGMGKGYAVDQMAKLLREWSIDVALISGGYSSVLALDRPAEMKGWPVTLSHPGKGRRTLARLEFQGRAVSGSGVQKGGHIINPRTGMPVTGRRAAWSVAPDAATGDALSTAFMIMAPEEIEDYCRGRKDVAAIVIQEAEGGREETLRFGRWDDMVSA
ncbi:MAG: FAD:protein FMN transferase [Sedimentisphaerales bacterium]|nr:FAD:protein FMN transferase [Sedimentisphaerales bacterium]